MAAAFTLNKLPYQLKALAPLISEETLSFHYGKHHAGYVARLNELTAGTPLASKSIPELCKSFGKVPAGVFNSAAQIYNHDFYWTSLAPATDSTVAVREPTGQVKQAIDSSFGSFDNFKREFTAAAAGHFGSGWAWLVHDTKDGKIKIVQTHDAGTPIQESHLVPLLTCDVWEHAYYIDYRNARASYIDSWWKLVNWDFANENLKVTVKA
ncbi:Superoxide dismutase [Gonapodya sp. JEL0774]|nr:Superoxide dismutase [Gonapodya sp. JEL0774]